MSKRDQEHFELDAHALAMIAAYRREETLPADVHDRVWERVESEVAAPAPTGMGAAKWGVVLLAAAAAIAAVVVGSQALVPSEAAPQPQQAPYEHEGARESGEVERPAHVERSRAPGAALQGAAAGEPEAPPLEATTPEELAASPAEIATAEPRSSKPRTRRPARDEAPEEIVEPAPEPTAPADTLAEETRTLERARKALTNSRPIVALAILDDYERRFPAARLAPERNALRAIALCDAGRSNEGSKAADAFLAKHSGHALASRVRRACDR